MRVKENFFFFENSKEFDGALFYKTVAKKFETFVFQDSNYPLFCGGNFFFVLISLWLDFVHACYKINKPASIRELELTFAEHNLYTRIRWVFRQFFPFLGTFQTVKFVTKSFKMI